MFTAQSFITAITGATGMGTQGVCGYILSTTTVNFGKIDVFFKSQIFPS